VHTLNTRLTFLLIGCLVGSISAVSIFVDDAVADDAVASGDGSLAFRVGVLWPAEGPVVRGAILVVREGHIAKILGSDDAVPEGLEITDLGSESIVLPTFVNPISRIHERDSNVRSRHFNSAISSASATPGDKRKVRALTSFQHRAEIYERLVETGYGAIALVPSGAAFLSGQSAVIRPGKAGKTTKKEDLVLLEDAYLGMSFRRGKTGRDAADRLFKKALDRIKKQREAKKKKEEEEKNKEKGKPGAGKDADKKKLGTRAPPGPPKPPATPPGVGAKPAAAKPPPPPDVLVEVLEGKKRVFWLLNDDTANIDHAMRLFDKLEQKFRFVLMTDAQEPDVVERLAKRKEHISGVVLSPQMGRHSESSIYFQPAGLFERAGLPVAFVPRTDDFEGHRNIFYYLAEMVKSGLGRDQVLRAVTLNPARFLGLDRRLGSLVVGKEASFVVYDADPFNGLTRPRAVYHQGVRVFPAKKNGEDSSKSSAEVEQ
jgi:imidazolonepropionase-like amidohydrolase